MKAYLAEKIFPCMDFPLKVSCSSQLASMPQHYHDFVELVLVRQGHSIHNIYTNGADGKISYGIMQGDVFSIMPGEVHEYDRSKRFVVYNLAFHQQLISPEAANMEKLPSWRALYDPNPGIIRSKIHLTLSEHLAAEQCLKKIILELSSKKAGFRLSAKNALIDFLIIAGRANSIGWKTMKSGDNSGIIGSIEAMQTALNQPFDLNFYAKIASMSVSSYTRKFREATGLSPLDYFFCMRMEQIRWLLAETDLPLEEIAFQCGFCDTSYMIKSFRVHQGITPAKYRQIIR